MILCTLLSFRLNRRDPIPDIEYVENFSMVNKLKDGGNVWRPLVNRRKRGTLKLNPCLIFIQRFILSFMSQSELKSRSPGNETKCPRCQVFYFLIPKVGSLIGEEKSVFLVHYPYSLPGSYKGTFTMNNPSFKGTPLCSYPLSLKGVVTR